MDVKSAGRTVDLFEVFAREQTPLSLTDIGRALSAPLTSCLYLVRALEIRGYLYTLQSRRQIYPTRKLQDVALAISAGEPSLARIEPVLEKLRDATRETVILAARQGTSVVYLTVLEGQQTIRYTARIGDLKPLHSSSAGKVLLSILPSAERTKLIAKLKLERVTTSTVTDRASLIADIQRCARRGYSETRGENVADVMAVAKTVRIEGDPYAIVVAGPMHRMTKQAAEHLKQLTAACTEITGTQ